MNATWKYLISLSSNEGNRNHMEDFMCNHIEKRGDDNIFCLFGVFDGHGGHEAAEFLKENIVRKLKDTEKFWSNNDEDVKESIKDVFEQIQNDLWIERESWPDTISGYKSTAGTTATIVIIRNFTVFSAHLGDSAVVLIEDDKIKLLTKEHKPNNNAERNRVISSGGSIRVRAGTVRVVWNRRKKVPSHQLMNDKFKSKRQQSSVEHVPFLAITRSLGDLWSYDNRSGCYHVSPEPDITCRSLDPTKNYQLILGSDGLWTVMQPNDVADWLTNNKPASTTIADYLMQFCLNQWTDKGCGADNISIIIVNLMPHSQSACSDAQFTTKYIEDFTQFKPQQSPSHIPTTLEYIKMFCYRNCTTSKLCRNWSDCLWERFYSNLIKQMPNKNQQLPDIITHLETYLIEELAIMFSAFPISVECLDLIETQPDIFPHQLIEYFQSQPLLSKFWSNFFSNFFNNVTSSEFDLVGIIKNKSQEITNLIDSFQKNNLKRCSSDENISESSLQKPKIYKYHSSASYIKCGNESSIIDSGASTPILNENNLSVESGVDVDNNICSASSFSPVYCLDENNISNMILPFLENNEKKDPSNSNTNIQHNNNISLTNF